MGIMDITIPTVDVKVKGGSFAVRGLNLEDLEILLHDSGAELEALFNMFTGNVKKEDAEAAKDMLGSDTKGFAMRAVRKLPGLISRAIALAADEYTDEAIAKLRKLPLGVQYDAIIEIGTLTLDAEGDPKKAVGGLLQLLGGLNDSLQQQAADVVNPKTP